MPTAAEDQIRCDSLSWTGNEAKDSKMVCRRKIRPTANAGESALRRDRETERRREREKDRQSVMRTRGIAARFG